MKARRQFSGVLRTISALAAALTSAVVVHLTWFMAPLESGLAFGHAILAALLGILLANRAWRLERQHFDWPHPSNTRGPALTSAAVLAWTDAIHATLVAIPQLDSLLALLIGGSLDR